MIAHYHLSPKSRVLEIGCAKGFTLVEFKKCGMEVAGVDVSDYAVSSAHPDVRSSIQVGGASYLPFPDQSFDFVFGKEVLPHIPLEKLEAVVRECMRVSKGKIFFEVQCGRTKEELDGMKQWDPTHHILWTPGEWDAFFERLQYPGDVHYKILVPDAPQMPVHSLRDDRLTEIRRIWAKRAREEGHDPHCTLPDYHLHALEAQYVLRHLKSSDVALDIGCGNGMTTVQFATRVSRIIGGDCVEEMLVRARAMHARENLEYRVLDILDLQIPDATFDVVIAERCLINLPDWEMQKQAIREVARVLKPGGRFLMSESYEEAFLAFAALRQRFGIPPMRRHPNNYLLREQWLRAFLPQLFDIVSVEKMGVYYFVSRIIHPLLVAPQEPRYDAPINDVAVRMALEMAPALFSEYSVNGLYVLQKKGGNS
jgi:ubiquinone/menaquinone biosynthesis C-methylase UbiE